MRHLALESVLIGIAAASPGCGPRGAQPVVVDVYVAASMAKVMSEIEADFEASHPGTDLRVVAGGSQLLATQIVEGAPAELLVTADATSMAAAASTGLVHDSAPLARNRLVMVARRDLAAPITSLRDLARPGLRLVLAAPEVPIGRYARDILRKAALEESVARNVVSLEADVLAVLAQVESGEADAALVYSTDVAARTQGHERDHESPLTAIAIDDELQPEVALQIGLVATSDGAARAVAQQLRAYLLTGKGRETLLARGFEAP
jgi:molybdate transport system substrate-binding protein